MNIIMQLHISTLKTHFQKIQGKQSAFAEPTPPAAVAISGMISVDVVLGSLFLEQGAVSLRQAKLGQDGVEEV